MSHPRMRDNQKQSGWHALTTQGQSSRDAPEPFPTLQSSAASTPLSPPQHTRGRRSGPQRPWDGTSPGWNVSNPATPSPDKRGSTSGRTPEAVPYAAVVGGSPEPRKPTNAGSSPDLDPGMLAFMVEAYPWADADLVQAVLEAANGEPDEATWLLTQLHGEPAGSTSSTALISGTALSSGTTLCSGTAFSQKAPLQSGADNARDRSASPTNCATVPHPRNSATHCGTVPHPTSSAGRVETSVNGLYAEGEASLLAHAHQQISDDDEGQDVYTRHRRSAMKLTREWRRAVRRACTAYRAGDAGEAARAAREARGLRGRALEEHAAAAQRILAENNQQRGLGRWSLDLHGLHGNEAVAAVEDRLAQLTTEAEPRGAKRELQVVVGSGTHSSGGEATLARIIQDRLLSTGTHRFSLRGASLYIHVPYRPAHA